MEKIMINDENIIVYYGNKAGYVKDDQAVVDPMFKHETLIDFLTKENRFNVNWKEGVFDALINNSAADTIGLKACRIHQFRPETDVRMKFISYDELIMRGFGKPNDVNYEVVFDGEIDTNDLHKIYDKFNEAQPLCYKGHSLSMSDVIELYDDKGRSFYYVDSIGFKEIEFTESVQQSHTQQGDQSPDDTEYTLETAQAEVFPEEAVQPQQEEEPEIYTFTL